MGSTLEMFDKYLAEEFSSLIFSRVLLKYDVHSRQNYFKTEMKLNDARAEKDCLLLRAYNLRSKCVIMEPPVLPILAW